MSLSESYQINLQILADAKQALADLQAVSAKLDALSQVAIKTTGNMKMISTAQAQAAAASSDLTAKIQAGSLVTAAQGEIVKGLSAEYQKHMGLLNELYGPNSQRAQKQYLNSISGLRQAFQGLNNEAGGTLVKTGKGVVTTLDSQAASMVKFRMQADMTVKTLDNLNAQWLNWAKNTQWTGRQMMVGISAPIAAVGAITAGVALQQDQASMQAKVLSGYYNGGVGAQNYTADQAAAKKYSTTYGTTYAQNISAIGNLQGMAGSSGWNNQNVQQIAQAGQNFNLISQSNDIGGSTDFIRQLAQASGIQTGQGQANYAQNAVAFLNQVQQVGSINAQQLPAALQPMMGLMQSSGMNLGEAIGLISQSKAQGINVDTFTHQLATSIGRIQSALSTGFLGTKGGNSKPIEEAIAAFNRQTGSNIQMFNKDGTLAPASEWIANLAKALSLNQGTAAAQGLSSKIFSNRAFANLLPVFTQLGDTLTGKSFGANSDYTKIVDLYNGTNGQGGFGSSQQQDMLNGTVKGMQNDQYTKLQNAKNALMNDLATIGNDILPDITSFVHKIVSVADKFASLPKHTRTMIEGALGLAALVGPLVYMFAQMNVLMSTVSKFAIMKPLKTVFGLKSFPNLNPSEGDISHQLSKNVADYRAGVISPEQFQARKSELINSYGKDLGSPIQQAQVEATHETTAAVDRVNETLKAQKSFLVPKENGKGSEFVSQQEAAKRGYPVGNNSLKQNSAGKWIRPNGQFATEAEVAAMQGESTALESTAAAKAAGDLAAKAGKGIEKETVKGLENAAETASKGGFFSKLMSHMPNPASLLGGSSKGGIVSKLIGGGGGFEALLPGAEGAGATTGLLALGPVLLPVLAAVAAAIALIATHWSTFYNAVSPAIKELTKAFSSFLKSIEAPFKGVIQQFSDMSSGTSLATTIVKGLGDAVSALIKVISKIIDAAKPVADFFANYLADAFGTVISVISAIVDLCHGNFSQAWNEVKVAAGYAVDAIIAGLLAIPRTMLKITSIMAEGGSKLFGWVPGLGSGLKDISNALQKANNELGKLPQDAKNAIDSTTTAMNKNTDATNKNTDAAKKNVNAKTQGAGGGSATPTIDPNNLASTADTTGADLVSALQSNLKNVVGDWVTAADQAFQDYKTKRLQAVQDTITAFDAQTAAQDKMYANEKSNLTKLQTQQDNYNKSLTDAANIQLDLVEGKYSDANTLFIQQQQDKTKAANQAASNQIDTAKQAYDDQRATQKQALTDQKQALSDQLTAQEQSLKEQLDTMTKYLPRSQDEAAAMQQGILNVLQSYTPGYGDAVTANITGSKGWQESFNTAIQMAQQDVNDKAYWAGATAAQYFGSGFSNPNGTTPNDGSGGSSSSSDSGNGSSSNGTPPAGPPPSSISSGSVGGLAGPSAAAAQMAQTGYTQATDASNTGFIVKGNKYFHTGGQIPGFAPDDVPIVAQAGEFMIQRKAAQALGLDALNVLNNAHALPELPSFHTGGTIPVGNYLNTLMSKLVPSWEKGGPPKTIDGMTAAQANAKVGATKAGNIISAVVGGIPTGEHLSLIKKALSLAGVLDNAANEAYVNEIVQSESTWNPNAINLWDSNARAGHPSKGLMQTIDSTFAAYRLPSLSNNVYDPLSNLVAGIRYAIANYGSLSNVPGVEALSAGKGYVGYHTGGLIQLASFDTGGKVIGNGIAQLHDGETVLKKPLAQQLENNIMSGGGGGYEIHVNLNGAYFGTDAELQKLGQYMESNVLPKIRRAAGNEQRDFSSYK